jgi:hypothetical protein
MNNKTPWSGFSTQKIFFHQSRTWTMILRDLVKKMKNPLHFWKACTSLLVICTLEFVVEGLLECFWILPSFLSCKCGLMYVGSFLSLVASGDEFKANQLQIEHDLLVTRLLACWLTINHLIWCCYESLPYFLNSILFMLTCPIYTYISTC